MKRYVATLTAEFSVEAENIVEARRVASRIRAISGGWYGRRFSAHDRIGTSYRIDRTVESVTVVRAPGNGGGRP